MSMIDHMLDESKFTSTENFVLKTIIENIHDIKNMTINQLAHLSNSSNSTIVRICRKLGFKGYPDFKVKIIQELEASKYFTDDVDVNLPFANNENTIDIVKRLSSLYKTTIDLINSTLDVSVINDITTCILKSNRIFIFSIGDSRITSMSFMNKLNKINIYPIIATDNHEELATANNMQKEDVALFLTYRADIIVYNQCLDIVKSKKAKIIVVSAKNDTRMTQESDYSILIPDREIDSNIARFYSQLSLEYILNIIYSSIYNKNYLYNYKRKKIYINKKEGTS